jgi:hypothetical protein
MGVPAGVIIYIWLIIYVYSIAVKKARVLGREFQATQSPFR